MLDMLDMLVEVLTLTRASVRLVHMAISSRVDMSGYLFLEKVASSSWSCWEVKCVRCRRCRFPGLAFPPRPDPPSLPSSPPPSSVLIPVTPQIPETKKIFHFVSLVASRFVQNLKHLGTSEMTQRQFLWSCRY